MSQNSQLTVTREGWYYLGMLGFIVAGAIIRDINLLYIMAGMMLGPLLYSLYASTKSLRGMDVTRRFQPLVSVGFPMYVELQLEKAKGTSRAWSLVIRDRIGRDARTSQAYVDARMFVPHVTPGSPAETSWRTTLQRRGRYRLGPMRISTSMPLGLIKASTSVGANEWVLVSPRLGTLSPAWKRYLEMKNDGGQKSARRRGISEGDFYGMREWRNGDSRNWIHWRTSAKRNKLTVRQFEQRIDQDLVVVLDLWQPKKKSPRRPETEQAISFAATLAVDYGKHGAAQMLIASSSEAGFLLQGTSSPVLRQELLQRLAVVEPTTKSTLPEVLGNALSKSSRKARIVLVTTRDIDLADSAFGDVWKRADIRRSVNDIAIANAASPEFENWFTLDWQPSTSMSSETLPLAQDVSPTSEVQRSSS